MLNGLSLFSGIGGLDLALAPWVRPITYCEIDSYARGVLLSRMAEGALPSAPIWTDVVTLGRESLYNVPVDIIYGGFPCQDISVAGNGKGLEGERSGLVFEVFRLIDELAPAFVFLENVPAIRIRGGERVVKELASRGYDCRWDVLSAYDVGAPHLRKRWFLLAAHPQRLKLWDEQGRSSGANREGPSFPGDDGAAGVVAYPNGEGSLSASHSRVHRGEEGSGARYEQFERLSAPFDFRWWSTEPDVGRVAHGVPKRVDRLRALGNAVVPAQAREEFRRLMGLVEEE